MKYYISLVLLLSALCVSSSFPHYHHGQARVKGVSAHAKGVPAYAKKKVAKSPKAVHQQQQDVVLSHKDSLALKKEEEEQIKAIDSAIAECQQCVKKLKAMGRQAEAGRVEQDMATMRATRNELKQELKRYDRYEASSESVGELKDAEQAAPAAHGAHQG